MATRKTYETLTNVEIEDVDPSDYPDFCDAYVAYAETQDGDVLTQDELDELHNFHMDLVYEYVIQSVYGGD